VARTRSRTSIRKHRPAERPPTKRRAKPLQEGPPWPEPGPVPASENIGRRSGLLQKTGQSRCRRALRGPNPVPYQHPKTSAGGAASYKKNGAKPATQTTSLCRVDKRSASTARRNEKTTKRPSSQPTNHPTPLTSTRPSGDNYRSIKGKDRRGAPVVIQCSDFAFRMLCF